MTTPDRDDIYWRLVDLLAVPHDVGVIDTPAGDSVLTPDTIAGLADLIAEDMELTRLIRAQVWAGGSA